MTISPEIITNVVLFGVAMALGYLFLLIIVIGSLADYLINSNKIKISILTNKVLYFIMYCVLFSVFMVSVVGAYYGDVYTGDFSLVSFISGFLVSLVQVGVYINFYSKFKKSKYSTFN